MEDIFFISVLGLIPAVIAERKGRNFVLWWVYGVLLFIVALIHSLLLKDKRSPEEKREWYEKRRTNEKRLRTCPNCGLKIQERDVKCSCCGKELNDNMGNFDVFPGL